MFKPITLAAVTPITSGSNICDPISTATRQRFTVINRKVTPDQNTSADVATPSPVVALRKPLLKRKRTRRSLPSGTSPVHVDFEFFGISPLPLGSSGNDHGLMLSIVIPIVIADFFSMFSVSPFCIRKILFSMFKVRTATLVFCSHKVAFPPCALLFVVSFFPVRALPVSGAASFAFSGYSIFAVPFLVIARNRLRNIARRTSFFGYDFVSQDVNLHRQVSFWSGLADRFSDLSGRLYFSTGGVLCSR